MCGAILQFYQSGPCYVALGDKLSLMVEDTRKHHLKIQKRISSSTRDDPVCVIKYDMIRKAECDLFNNRHDEVSVNNGILIINTVIRADSGNYRLELNHSDGSVTSTDLQVIIEDDGSVGSVRRFSHLHETHVRKETGRSKRANEKI
ncbi:hypothetical protein PO909_007361 [Leuciscus waleckii]